MLSMGGFWAVFWIAVVLKIPLVALLVIVWWAIKDPPLPEAEDDGRGGVPTAIRPGTPAGAHRARRAEAHTAIPRPPPRNAFALRGHAGACPPGIASSCRSSAPPRAAAIGSYVAQRRCATGLPRRRRRSSAADDTTAADDADGPPAAGKVITFLIVSVRGAISTQLRERFAAPRDLFVKPPAVPVAFAR